MEILRVSFFFTMCLARGPKVNSQTATIPHQVEGKPVNLEKHKENVSCEKKKKKKKSSRKIGNVSSFDYQNTLQKRGQSSIKVENSRGYFGNHITLLAKYHKNFPRKTTSYLCKLGI